jgi:hypothetical protein
VTTHEHVRTAANRVAAAYHVDERAIRPDTPFASLLGDALPASGAEGAAEDSLELLEWTMLFEEMADALVDFPLPEADLDTWKRLLQTGTVQELADFLDGNDA